MMTERDVPEKVDVAIIGGGVVGSAIAYYLTKSGTSVALIEKNEIGSGASGVNPGFVVALYREHPLLLSMALDQLDHFDDLSEELNIDLEYEPTGGMLPVFNEAERESVSRLMKRNQDWGLKDAVMLDSSEARSVEPCLSPNVLGAGYSPSEGKINPFHITLGFAKEASKKGAHISVHTEVTGFKCSSQKVTELETTAGPVKADTFVISTGAWTEGLGRLLGLDLPVYYHRGEAIITSPVTPTLKGIVTDGMFFVKKAKTSGRHYGAAMAQTKDGGIVLAQATSDVEDYDRRCTYWGVHVVANRVGTIFPKFNDFEIVRSWGGVTPYTDDSLPLFGYLKSYPNVFMSASFHSAIALSPQIGMMAADLITKGKTFRDVSPFAPGRMGL
jgi:glycine/D-amino acid oxidase-like deaminating enzyme